MSLLPSMTQCGGARVVGFDYVTNEISALSRGFAFSSTTGTEYRNLRPTCVFLESRE